MLDIARALGVSQSTVSRVLSGAPSTVPIADRTRERILEEARRLGYRPNPLASGLRGARTRLLGVIMSIFGPFATGAMDVLSAEANSLGYNTVLGNAHGRADEAMAIRTVLETRHCDAILLVGDTSDHPRLVDDLRTTAVPLVAMWQGVALPGICTVNVDNQAGTDALLNHLASLGHRRIAFIGAAGRQGDIYQRQLAYLDFMTRMGQETPPSFIHQSPDDPAGGAEGLEALLRLPEPPTAVYCSTDVLAIGALHGAHRSGVRVPGDVSIVGFDDIPFAAFTVPSLTTVHMPTAEMARIGVRKALEPDPGPEAKEFKVSPSLVIRESTGPA